MKTTTLVRTLQVDAAANIVAGIALVAAGGLLAAPLGLAAAWPLRLAGVGLAVYGIENLAVSRHPTRGGVGALAAIDVVFAAATLFVALADPTGAETGMRWGLAAVADLSLLMGVAKIAGLRSLRRPDRPASHGLTHA